MEYECIIKCYSIVTKEGFQNDKHFYDLTVRSLLHDECTGSRQCLEGKVKSIMEPFSSKRNEGGNVQAGTHLIIMDNSSCHETIQKSNPVILNYYRQFLIKGFDC